MPRAPGSWPSGQRANALASSRGDRGMRVGTPEPCPRSLGIAPTPVALTLGSHHAPGRNTHIRASENVYLLPSTGTQAPWEPLF